MPNYERGYSVPLLLLVALTLLAVPVSYKFLSNSFSGSNSNVRGATSIGSVLTQPGMSVSIVSTSQAWDLVEYLCKDLDECLDTLTSGRRLGTVSGGQTELHEIVMVYSREWDDYHYVKLFVRPSWLSSDDMFVVQRLGDVPDSSIHTLTEDGEDYQVVLVPVKELRDTFYVSALFSDR